MFLTNLWCMAAERPARDRSDSVAPSDAIHPIFGQNLGAVHCKGALLRALTAGLLALAAFTFAATASADVLVSNIDKSEVGPLTTTLDLAQGFMTGGNPSGYTLTNIEIAFAQTIDKTTPTVTVHEDSPTGVRIATLTGPATVSTGNQTFTAIAGVTLNPMTEYFVVLEGTASGALLSTTASDDQDSTGKSDWSIHDGLHYRTASSTVPFTEWHPSKRIRVNGTVRDLDATLPGEIWGSTVVVKDHSSNATVGYGSDFTDSTSSSTQFTHSSTQYTVQQVYNSAATGSLTIVLSPHPAAATVSDLSLKVGSEVLRFSAATRNTSGFTWTDSAKWDSTNTPFTNDASLIMKIAKNSAATGKPTIQVPNGYRVPAALSADVSLINDTNGLVGVDFTYQWIRVDGMTETNIGTDSDTYTLAAADVGKKIKLKVSFTDNAGFAEERISDAVPDSTSTVRAALTFYSATVNGTSLVLTFSAGLGAAATLANSVFTVKVGGSTVTLSGTPAISGTTVTLTLATAVAAGDTVTVAYTHPPTGSNNMLVDTDGNAVATFGDQSVTNTTVTPPTAPTAASDTVTTPEDTAYTFTAADFGFMDVNPGDMLASVRIVTRPTRGTLKLNTVIVSAGAVVPAAQLGSLTYTPPANANGTSYTHFTFTVNDGTADSALTYTMTLTVTAVNDAPEVANAIPDQTAMAGVEFNYVFPAATFEDVDDDTLTYNVTLSDGTTALPSWLNFVSGTRTFSGTPPDLGTVSVKVTADDANGGTAEDEFVLVVVNAVLVSNIGQTYNGVQPLNNADGAQGFETGAHAGGYTVTSVDLRLQTTNSGIAVPRVRLVSGSPEAMGGVALTGPDSLVAGNLRNYAFTAPDGTKLKPSTRYWIVVERFPGSSGIHVRLVHTASSNEDATPATGWSIDDEGEARIVSSAIGFTTRTNKYMLRIRGRPIANPVAVHFDAASYTATEGGAAATVTVTLSRAPGAEVQIPLTVTRNGAAEGDYTVTPATVRFGATDTSTTVGVTATDDLTDDDNESIMLGFDLPAGYAAGATPTTTVALVDNDAAPTVELVLTPPRITENVCHGSPIVCEGRVTATLSRVTATLSHASSGDTTVTVAAAPVTVAAALDVSPAVADDFRLSDNRTLTIAAGATDSTGVVTVTAEDNETHSLPFKHVTVSGMATNMQGIAGDPADATLTITEGDEAPTVRLTLLDTAINEDGGVGTVTVTLSHASSEETTVTVTADPADAVMLSPDTVTIEAGATVGTVTVTVTAQDNETDGPERKTVTIAGRPFNPISITSPSPRTLTIIDDDDPPVVTLAVTPDEIPEDSGVGTVTVTLSHASSEETTVTVTADPADAVMLSPDTVTIEAGATVSTVPVVTLTAEDNDIDGPERKTVTIAADAENALGVTNSAATTLTIIDDDDPPVVTLAVTPDEITEDSGQSMVTATLNRPSGREIVVTVATDPAYELSADPRLTFQAGEETSPDVVTLTARDNDIDADDAEILVGGQATPSDSTVTAAKLTITDDDTRGVLVSKETLSIREGNTDTDAYTVVLASEPTADVTIAVASDDTAVEVPTPPLTFTPSNWQTPQPVTVRAANDDVQNVPQVEAELTHSVNGTGGDYAGESADAVDVTVTDDESPSTAVTLGVNSAAVSEGTSSRTVTVTGELDGAPRSVDTVVTVAVTAGTATLDTDFTVANVSTLTIAAGDPSGTATFTLMPVNDTIDEPDETVTVGGSTTAMLDVTEATVTITDNDAAPTVTLALLANPISEGATTQVRAMLSHPSSAETTVEVSATAVHPAVDTDFTLSETSLTIPAEDVESSRYATLRAEDNNVDEADKQVEVRGRAENDQGVQTPNVGPVTVTITDDDAPVVEPQEDRAPQYVEGGTGPVATYTASNPANVRLTWSLEGDDKDAFTIANGVLSFQPPPDYEQPTDANLDNDYEVTVQAADGTSLPGETLTGTLAVTVTVKDAVGKVSLSSSQPRVGVALTTTVDDPDGVDPAPTDPDTWCWERSLLPAFLSNETTDVDCTPTTTGTYPPVADDERHYLRVTVTYTDDQGTRKGELRELLVHADTSEPVDPAPSRPRSSSSGGGGGGGGACTQDDVHGNSAAQATAMALATETGGALCPAADVDYFTVTAPGQGLLFVDTFGGVELRGTLWQNDAVLAAGSTGRLPDDRLGARVQAGLVVVAVQGQGGATGTYEVEITFVRGNLENPGPASFQSGVGVLSGWVCAAAVVEIELNGIPQEAAYGTERLDTAGACGDTDNGFGLLFNWNLLRDGEHEVVALVDGVELDWARVTVTTLGQEFLRERNGDV